MSADFVAGYVSGAVGIVIGNPLDLLKTRIQAGSVQGQYIAAATSWTKQFDQWSALVRGTAAPILGYGALNALLFVTYNRSLALLDTGSLEVAPVHSSAINIWAAGALGGLATFIVSAPTELVKCRAQVSEPPRSSWQVTKDIWRTSGIRGMYLGGTVTSLRDSIGYGFYFWSYELLKRQIGSAEDNARTEAMKVLLCGGVAGVVTWASIFPLDVIKTRVQTHTHHVSASASVLSASSAERRPLLHQSTALISSRPTAIQIAVQMYRDEGIAVFFRGFGVCSARAFIVNAVQWAIYEWMMKVLTKS